MKKKTVVILFCALLIATIAIPVTGATDEIIKSENKDNSYSLLNREWYWKPPYPNFAPSGMPDFDQVESPPLHIWGSIREPLIGGNGVADTTAVGNDIQLIPVGNPVNPGDFIIAPGPDCDLDTFEEVDDVFVWSFCGPVAIANCFWYFDSQFADPDGWPGDGEDIFPLVGDFGAGDDHAMENVPLLIESLAVVIQTNMVGWTPVDNLVDGINLWLVETGLDNMFEVNMYEAPSWDLVRDEILRSQNVILHIGLYDQLEDNTCVRRDGHYVTCAGVDINNLRLGFSDPFFDVENPPPPNHNDAQFVSHDDYGIRFNCPCINLDFQWRIPNYPPGNIFDFAFVENAIIICPLENLPPEAPSINGPASGKVGISYTYVFNAEDPNIDDVRYIINWGDGDTDVTDFNPSGTDVEVQHTWSEKGTFFITAIAEDINGLVSSESTLKVTMPKDIKIYSSFIQFLQSNPILYKIMEKILQRLGL